MPLKYGLCVPCSYSIKINKGAVGVLIIDSAREALAVGSYRIRAEFFLTEAIGKKSQGLGQKFGVDFFQNGVDFFKKSRYYFWLAATG
ncbi:MAG: hypothetical protein IJ892_10300 [Prevotella sp.]|nr:hypothetical protein [Prevotella sp.]